MDTCRECIFWDFRHPRWREGVTEELKSKIKDGELGSHDFVEAECSCNPPALLNGEFVRPFTIGSDRCMHRRTDYGAVHYSRYVDPDDVEK